MDNPFTDFLQKKDQQAKPAAATPQKFVGPPTTLAPTPKPAPEPPQDVIKTHTSETVKAKSFSTFMQSKEDKKKIDAPATPFSKMSTWDQAKMIATHGSVDLDIATTVFQNTMKGIHEAVATQAAKLPTPETVTQKLLEPPNAVLQNPKSLPEEKQKAMKQIQMINSPLFQATLAPMKAESIVANAAVTTAADWESMGALFKPLELVSPIAKAFMGDTQPVRYAVTALNTMLGAKFSYDQLQSGLDHLHRGEYTEAMSDFGGSGALLFMPALHHIMAEPGAYAGEMDAKKTAELKGRIAKDLDVAAEQAKKSPNPPFTPEQFARAQAALKSNNPLQSLNTFEKASLDLQETAHKGKLAAANAESNRQSSIAQREADAQDDVHRLKIDAANRGTVAERDKDLRDANAREAAHQNRLANEKARFQRSTPPTPEPEPEPPPVPKQLDEPPNPEKRAFEEPAALVAGRQPLTATERENQRYDERVDQARKELAAEKQRRVYVAQRAVHEAADTFDERRERELRAGQTFAVNDLRRTLDATPGAATATQPAAEGTATTLTPTPTPPPNLREIEGHEAAASWSIMEYEKRLGKAETSQERQELEKEIAENKKLLEDLRADKDAARTLSGAPPQPQHKAGDQIASFDGNQTTLKTVTRDIPVRYKLVEGGDLTTSHHHETFQPNAGYPEDVQERDYKNDKDAQVAVIQHGQQYDPAFTISDAPGPEHGPPIVTPDGMVLGGNSRVMSTMRHYEADGKAYREALAAKAGQFGVDPAKLAVMEHPILVREVTNPPSSINELRALGSDLNRVFTRKLSEYEQAVSAGKRISQETMDYVGHQLTEGGEGTSLRDLLRDRSGPIIEKLSADGIIAQNELRAFIDEKTGTLNDAGKDFIERALLGAVVDDPVVLANSPKSVLRKVERALPSLARIKARGEPWDITDYLKEALREHITAASKGESIEDHLNPRTASMFQREPVHPIVEVLAHALSEKSSEVQDAFESYAQDSAADVKGQGGLGFYTPPKPWEAFNQAFGTDVEPEDWGTLKAGSPPDGKAEKQSLDLGLDPTPGNRREEFRAGVMKGFKSATPEQVDGVMAIIDARAKTLGMTTDQWLDRRVAGVESMESKDSPRKKRLAEVEDAKDGRVILRAFMDKDPKIQTLVHEVGHIFRKDLTMSDAGGMKGLLELEDWAGKMHHSPEHGTVWGPGAEEKFARAFELYVREGKAPTPELEGVFAKFKTWLSEVARYLDRVIYKRAQPDQKISAIFDRMLGGTGEKSPELTDVPKPSENSPELKAAPAALEPTPETPKTFENFKKESSESKVDTSSAAKDMTDEDLQRVVDDLKTKTDAARPEAKARMEAMAKPFKKELDKRGGPSKGGEDKSVVFTKDRFEAALAALKKGDPVQKKAPKITLGDTADDDKMVDSISTVMGHLFENGYRDFESNLSKMVDLAGEYTRPYARAAFDRMLDEGKRVASNRLQSIIPERERQRVSSQLGLFETHQAKNRRIELPKGVGVPHETTKARENPKSNELRKELDARPGSEGREEAGRTLEASNQPRGSDALGGSGRDVRPVGKGNRGGGIEEAPARPLRNVKTPAIDVDSIPTLNPTVEPGEWRSRLVAANLAPEIPPPTRGLTPAVEAKLLFKGQPEIVQTALTSLDKYGATVLATTTGTGKTYTGSAIFAEERPRFGLILTPSGNLNDNWVKTAKEFGVDVKELPKSGIPTEPGVYIGTYKTAGARQNLEKVGWNLLLADESHRARRWYAGTGDGIFLKKIANATDKVVFASATPFHSALEMGYMDKLGVWKKQGFENWAGKEFNAHKNDLTGKWSSPFNPRKLAALRDELITRGMFINLDRDMRGYDVNFAISRLKPQESEGLKNIGKAFKLAEEYFTQVGLPQMVQAVRGNSTTFIKSFLERARLPEAIDLGKKLEKQGWKVAYFTENKAEVSELYDFLKDADKFWGGEISKLMPKLPSVVDTLKASFGEDIGNFTGAHNANRQEELDAFNRGDKKHIVATYGAGGLGVSMHDLSGTAPRAAIYLGPPWSGVMLDQAIGRPWRFGTKSNVQAYFLTSNAAPEVRLLLQKVQPRFESLKAAVSGVNKTDPIIQKMRNLDMQLDYELGNPDKVHSSEFMQTMDTNAINSIAELNIPAASEAMNKGMQVERRVPMEATPEEKKPAAQPTSLADSDPAKQIQDLMAKMNDLRDQRNQNAQVAKDVRRPLVPSGTDKDINDPRLLDRIQDQNAQAAGMPPDGGDKPPAPPEEVLGNQRIPEPGHATVQYDLADSKRSRAAYEFWKDRGYNLNEDVTKKLARMERGMGAYMAELHTAPYVLKQFPMTEALPKMYLEGERTLRRNVAEKKFLKNEILGDFKDDKNAKRRIFEALQRAHDPAKELAGAASEWVDHQPFSTKELAVAQRLRDEILNPMIDEVQNVRPDIGRRYRYAPLTRQIDELTPLLYPELNGKIPADLIPEFSLEVRQSLTKDPFSPHELQRKSTPPKALDIDEALDAYIPSMQRLADLTPLSRKAAIHLAGMPDSALKDYAKKYSRIFFGVPSEYPHLDKIHNDFARTIANATYSAALDLNPHFFAIHSLKVPWNVWPELGKGGTKYALQGYGRMTTPEGRDLVARSGVLMDTMYVIRKPTTKLGDRFSKFLHGGLQLSDAIDRGVAYLGGLEKAKDLGLFGPREQVGKVTWERLNELAASGVNVKNGLDFAYDTAARSNFMYTNANVQIFVRENPLLGMFKSFAVRQAEFMSNMRTLSKEAKAQDMEPEAFAAQKAAQGDYSYVDAPAKYRRMLMATAALALGTNQIKHFLGHLLSPPIAFASDTIDLLQKTADGKATEKMWHKWMMHGIEMFVPGAGWTVRQLDATPEKHP